MLNSINLNNKTYDQLMAEAIAQIPICCGEWTNINASDPGLTILQNLTAFQLLQQTTIDEINDDIRMNLLGLVGFEKRDNHPATVLLQAPEEGGGVLPDGYTLFSGETPFEIKGERVLNPWGLAAVYTHDQQGYREVSHVLRPKTQAVAYPFGKKPEEGNAVVIILSAPPEVGEPIYFWGQAEENRRRNPFPQEGGPQFSAVRWEYYTRNGWQPAAAQDETKGFLVEGAVSLTLSHGNPVRFSETPVEGYALRCVLERGDYDRAPRLQALSAHLFPVVQQHTRARCYVNRGGNQVCVAGEIATSGYLYVFCREETNGPYYLYQELPYPQAKGRYYTRTEHYDGVTLHFDCLLYGAGPVEEEDSVRVSCFDSEMIHHRSLGPIYGYEDQTISVDLVEHVVKDSFSLVVECPSEGSASEYVFVRPGATGEDELQYTLNSAEGTITIHHAGLGGGCYLYLADCAVTQGGRGNLLAHSTLEHRGGYDGTEVEHTFTNPGGGRGGETCDTAETLRRRFSSHMREITSAVRASDYEYLVQSIPGLCIHKVKAVVDGEKNLVTIAIKPDTDGARPVLSKSYLKEIDTYLQSRRMITTRFELQQPNYVSVGVSANLCVRGMTAHAQGEVEHLLGQLLDYVNGAQNFGHPVRFNEIYQKLVNLPFVEAVDALALTPETAEGATMVGGDIIVDDRSLCVPGNIRLTLRSHIR